jgi:TrpR-related protein YerC/YecD
MKSYPTKQDKELIKAFGLLKNDKEVKNFLRDLLTPSEIDEFSQRYHIARLLWKTDDSYQEIAKKAKASTTTVTRVSQWLFKEKWQGYAAVLRRIYGKSKR